MSQPLTRGLLGAPGRGLALGLAVLSLVALAGVTQLTLDNRIERWLAPTGDAATQHQRFQELFGDDGFVLVAYGGRDPLTAEALDLGLSVVEALEAAPHVAAVLGPPTVHRDLVDGADAGATRKLLLETPFYRRFIVSDSGDVAGLLVATEPGDDPAAARRLVSAVKEAVAPLEAAGFDVHLAGPPVLNVALDEASQREAQRSFPACFGLAILLLAWLFRCVRTTAVAVASAGLTILLTFGAMGLTGVPLNMVTSVLPSLLFVLSLASAIHVLRRFQTHRINGLAVEDALAASLDETARPCITAGVTTALGFGSLLTADMSPVRELGAFAALGLLISVAVNLTFGSALLLLLRPPAPDAARAFAGDSAFAQLPFRHPTLVWIGSGALIVVAAVGVGRIRVDSDPLAFLPRDARVVRDYEAVARDLTGYYALEVMVDVPDGWQQPEAWVELQRIEDTLAALPGVARVLSPLDLLRQLQHWQGGGADDWSLPRDEASARALLREFGSLVDAEGFPLIADEGRVVRVAALVNVMPSSEFGPIERSAREAVAALPSPFSGFVTGVVPRLVEAQIGLVHTQIRSFALAFVTIFGCMWLGLRSFRLACLSVPPNLLPIFVALGTMGLAGIALDAATVMMASVALGIAVDDTVHVLSAYGEEHSRDARGAAERAIARVGPAMFITTAAACVGFLALRLSDFLPIRWFGLLSALAIAVALLADAWLVPALLARLDRGAT
ncbi:MAG: MMPL family transporter [Deltaproteobacteria bacterium]|nr:MMPL family transporter [Deltaproteobacteria bacterium]MBW2446901.1 MMPL family transporter [Deltaproteobacteria bacterium]